MIASDVDGSSPLALRSALSVLRAAAERVAERHDVEVVRSAALVMRVDAGLRERFAARQAHDLVVADQDLRLRDRDHDAFLRRLGHDDGRRQPQIVALRHRRVDSPRLFSRNTRMIVMMSSIAVMFRKLISGSCALRRTALRSSALYRTIDALFGLPACQEEPGADRRTSLAHLEVDVVEQGVAVARSCAARRSR